MNRNEFGQCSHCGGGEILEIHTGSVIQNGTRRQNSKWFLKSHGLSDFADFVG